METPVNQTSVAARALLQAAWRGDTKLTAKAGQFAGQVSVSSDPLSDRQLEWLEGLIERAGLTGRIEGGQHG